MPKTIRNEFNKKLTYKNLMNAHLESRKGKILRKEIILFNIKQEEYIMWLYEKLKSGTYKHSGYTEFYVTELVLIGEAITTTMARTIQLLTAITTTRPTATTTLVSESHSNIISDYIFYGIYTVKY